MAKKEFPDIELTVRLDNDGPNATKWSVIYGSKTVQYDVISGKGSWGKAGQAGERKKREILDQYYKTGEVKRVEKFRAGSFLGVPRVRRK